MLWNFEKLVLPKVAAGVKIESDVAKEFLEDAIAKDIMGRYARGEEIDADVKDQIALAK